jgi:hypothetical protein
MTISSALWVRVLAPFSYHPEVRGIPQGPDDSFGAWLTQKIFCPIGQNVGTFGAFWCTI